jgi:hypothetical protein
MIGAPAGDDTLRARLACIDPPARVTVASSGGALEADQLAAHDLVFLAASDADLVGQIRTSALLRDFTIGEDGIIRLIPFQETQRPLVDLV